MTSQGEHYMEMARRWFTEGWTGNLALADEIFSADVRHFEDGLVVEILTLQDQFGFLKQIGYLPADVRAALQPSEGSHGPSPNGANRHRHRRQPRHWAGDHPRSGH